MEEPFTSSDFPFRRINKKSSDQLPGPKQSGSGDASGGGDPIIYDDQSLFLHSEDSCSQSSESSVSFSGASAVLANAVLADVGRITESQKRT